MVDLKTRNTTTLRISGLTPPARPADTAENATAPNSEEIKLAPQQLRSGADGSLLINVELPLGYHLNPAAPQRYMVTVDNGKTVTITKKNASRTSKDLQLPLRIPLQPAGVGSARLRVQLTLFYCREDNTGTCRIKTLVWEAPVEVTGDANAPNEVKVQGKVAAD